jgi:Fur family ferric uptake transcriptional regulator
MKKASRPAKRIDSHESPGVDLRAEAQHVLDEYLRTRGLKKSTKRDCILNVFLGTRDHVSTEQLHGLVKAEDPTIGYTTVYRTLKVLADCGLASEIAFHDGVSRYERILNRRNHHHMVCTCCGDSIEFFASEIEAVERRIGRRFAFSPSRHSFQIYGTCQNCRNKQKSS